MPTSTVASARPGPYQRSLEKRSRSASSQANGLASSRPFRMCVPVWNGFSLLKPLTMRPMNERPLCASGEPKFAGASIRKRRTGLVVGL